MSKRESGRNPAFSGIKQGDLKNGERENSERTFSVSARNPQGCTRSPSGELRNGPACAEAAAGRESGLMCGRAPACAVPGTADR